jgi:hypothetical protein
MVIAHLARLHLVHPFLVALLVVALAAVEVGRHRGADLQHSRAERIDGGVEGSVAGGVHGCRRSCRSMVASCGFGLAPLFHQSQRRRVEPRLEGGAGVRAGGGLREQRVSLAALMGHPLVQRAPRQRWLLRARRGH